MTTILRAKPLVEAQTENLLKRCQALRAKGVIPSLKIFLVGEDPASHIYTQNKKRFAEKISADCEIIRLDKNIGEKEFLQQLHQTVEDPLVHGVMVQSPVPSQLKKIDLHTLIPANKDVDGFHKENMGKLLLGELENLFIPCTPKGIISLLQFYGYPLKGKHVVIIGRGAIVGRPMMALCLAYSATVTICHSQTQNLIEHTQRADIIIVAIGKARFLKKEHLSPHHKQIIIDVGINALPENDQKICGDADYDNVLPYVEAITPVPGGVGPLTILSLAENLLISAESTLIHQEKAHT